MTAVMFPEDSEAPEGTGTVAVGLVADPGLCTKVAELLATELPEVLSQQISSRIDWRVHLTTDTIPLDASGDLLMIEYARGTMPREGWDILVYITDLPQRAATRPVLAEFSVTSHAAQVSLPAVGWFRLRPHVRETIVYLVGKIAGPELTDGYLEQRIWPRLVRLRLVEQVSPVRRVPSVHEGIDAHLTLVGARGRARLLFGMVRNNRPWRLVPSLGRATAAAAGFAGFVIFYSTVWRLADVLSPPRLLVINLFAVVAMVAWLILHNHLWERPLDGGPGGWVLMYNASTVLTLFIGVVFMYAALFVFAAAAATVVIPAGYLGVVLGHPASWQDYAVLVWLASSIGTVAGALGSGLESEDTVRRAVYSIRERERRAKRREEERARRREQEEEEGSA